MSRPKAVGARPHSGFWTIALAGFVAAPLRRLIDAFAASEIRLAAPNVTVHLTSAAAG